MFGTFALQQNNTFLLTSKPNTFNNSNAKAEHLLLLISLPLMSFSTREQMKPLLPSPAKGLFYSRSLRVLLLLFSLCTLLYFITSLTLVWTNPYIRTFLPTSSRLSTSPLLHQIVFGIASTQKSWPKHKELIKIWWKPNQMRGSIFVDSLPPNYLSNNINNSNSNSSDSFSVPEIRISEDISRFRYTYKHGYRTFIRVARVVAETVNLKHSDVKWYVFGDGDTVFFPSNLLKTLSKYDHEMWYYIGTNSEIHEQNHAHSFEMGFWGAGFAVSAPLAKVLAKVFDFCLERYPHLYGSDGRVYSCLAELGVGLTREPGFHQVDVRGNIFGLLAAHPLTPLVSLPHLGEVDPIFPNMTATNALKHLFAAVNIDSERMFQQTVCYDRWFSWTISVSWGYAVQIFDRHVFLPDALRVQDTFSPWRKGGASNYTFSTSPPHPDPCRRPVFFLDQTHAIGFSITTSYRFMAPDNCTYDPMASPLKLQEVVVHSRKSNLSMKQLQAPRRQCCNVLPSTKSSKLEILVRECKDDELIHMHA